MCTPFCCSVQPCSNAVAAICGSPAHTKRTRRTHRQTSATRSTMVPWLPVRVRHRWLRGAINPPMASRCGSRTHTTLANLKASDIGRQTNQTNSDRRRWWHLCHHGEHLMRVPWRQCRPCRPCPDAPATRRPHLCLWHGVKRHEGIPELVGVDVLSARRRHDHNAVSRWWKRPPPAADIASQPSQAVKPPV